MVLNSESYILRPSALPNDNETQVERGKRTLTDTASTTQLDETSKVEVDLVSNARELRGS